MTNDLSNDEIKILELIKSFIEKDIRTHHTIADLAKQFGTNKDKLKKQFHYYFGMGLFGYLRELRLQKAKTLLEQTDKPEAMIAKRAGFKSLPNFINAFKKKYNRLQHTLRTK